MVGLTLCSKTGFKCAEIYSACRIFYKHCKIFYKHCRFSCNGCMMLRIFLSIDIMRCVELLRHGMFLRKNFRFALQH